MSVRRKMIATFALSALIAGCDRFGAAPAPTSPPVAEPAVVESAAAEPAASPASTAPPPPAAPEPLTLRFVSPNLGPPTGGNEVAIDGRGFGPYPHVDFGDVQAWIRSVTPTEIRVTVPSPERQLVAGETWTVDVRVTNPPVGDDAPVSQTLVRAYSYVAEGGAPSGEPPAEAESDPAGAAPPPPPPAEAPEAPAAPPGPTLVARFTFETVTDPEDCSAPGTAVRFTDRSTGGVSGWLWDFGDGYHSDEQHPKHCYLAPGMRTVSLTVSGGGNSASASTIVIASME